MIVTEQGRIKLVDFGFAKKIGKDLTSSICGTLHSMPPEVLVDNDEL